MSKLVNWGRRKMEIERYEAIPLDDQNEEKLRYTVFHTIPEAPLFRDDIKFKQSLEDPLAKKR